MKNEKISIINKLLLVLNIVVLVMSSSVSVYAANYLYNGDEISYNNTSSGIQSTNVQGAISELYSSATDYSQIMTHFTNNPTGKFNEYGIELSAPSNQGGYIDFHYNNSSSDYTSRIYESANGVLNLKAPNGVQVNGNTLSAFVSSGSATTSGTNITLPSAGTYILITGHNSTPSLNSIWIVRTSGNTAFRIGPSTSTVSVTVNGTTVNVSTQAGTVNTWYMLLN